ncbi:MAG: hypothetical protein MRZ90_08855 [Candidatus Gastranaerophilales bacterium]|nr:hypothetical protein [Candidatus Gastranaerophilales bacterium]
MKFNNSSLEFQILKYKNELDALLPNVSKSEVTFQLYNSILIKKAILVDKLKHKKQNIFSKIIKKVNFRKEKLICDYFTS